MAVRHGILGDGQRQAGGDAELFAHQVHAGGFLGHRVLHLQARVDLEEGDHAVGRHQVLDRAGTGVTGLAADGARRFVDAGALLVGQERRGGLLHEFLVAALQRAVAGTHHHNVPVRIREHLRLDVPGLVEEPFDEALAAPERHGGLAYRRVEGVINVLEPVGDLQPAPAAAERRLDGHGDAVFLGEGADFIGVGDRSVRARDQRGTRPDCDLTGGDLVAQAADRVRRRADPGEPGALHRLGEVGVFGEETVAGMDCIGTGPCCDVEQFGDVQVRVRARGTAQCVGLVAEADVQRVGIRVRIHRHGCQFRIGASPGNPDGDFAAVGDQDLLHGGFLRVHWAAVGWSVSGLTSTKRIVVPGGSWAAMGRSSGTTTATTGYPPVTG